jgi:hypothetical protein
MARIGDITYTNPMLSYSSSDACRGSGYGREELDRILEEVSP